MKKSFTVGELRQSGYQILSVKEEMRKNLIKKMRNGEILFPGIIGFERSVIPEIMNAILAKHDIILLGLRGQAKSRILRMLPNFLDDWIPIIKGSEINDHPFRPVSKHAVDLLAECGEATEIEWIPRDARYGEKLATPDVTIADLIGDIDPIKAASQRLHYSHEGAIHFGIIPRTNRGIFAINELPDLQPRIQVGLFNIMEEKDIQIRGFNIRIPLDIMIVFTANPEDYTNRGNIITPLKDRIASQILTHYPKTMDEAIKITQQEAWINRDGLDVHIPHYFAEIVEQIGFEARKSEFVDQKSGVSARLTIATMEILVSNAERRTIFSGEKRVTPRICDLVGTLPGITGKIELVFEGEQEGSVKVSKALIGRAVREVFKRYFPDPLKKRVRSYQEHRPEPPDPEYGKILAWFEAGNKIEVSDEMTTEQYFRELDKVKGLRELTKRHMKLAEESKEEFAAAMEFVLDGLHQNSKIAKDEVNNTTAYKDLVGSIFLQKGKSGLEDD